MQGQVSSLFSEVTGGDEARYREDRQVRDDYLGGLDYLFVEGKQNGWELNSEVRALNEVDLLLDNRLKKNEVAYINEEASVYPHYYDASNRFYDKPPYIYDLNTTLRTLRGDYSVEVGSLLPDIPKIFLGYRHRDRTGETNSYWGAWLRNASPDDFILFVQPIQRERNERTDTLYIGAREEIFGWLLEVRQDIERFEGVDTYVEPGYWNDGTQIFNRFYRNQPQHTTWTSAVSARREFLDDNLAIDTDYRFSSTLTDSTTDADTMTPAGALYYLEHSLNYNTAAHGGRSHMQDTGIQMDYTPWDWLRLWLGGSVLAGGSVGTSTRGEEGAEAVAVDGNNATDDETWLSQTINREVGWTENFGAEFNALPKSRLSVDVVMDQNRGRRDWNADVSGSANSGNEGDWSWLSLITEHRDMYSVSFRSWLIRQLPVLARYRYRLDGIDYDDQLDIANNKPGDPEYGETTTQYYYPGRIEDTRRSRHEILFSTTVKVGPRLTVNPRFEHANWHYQVEGEPVKEISNYRSNTVAVGVRTQPFDSLTWVMDLSRRFALTSTRAETTTNTLLSPNSTWFGGLTPEFDSSYTAFNSEVDFTWHSLTIFSTTGLVDGNGDFNTTLAHAGIGLRGPCNRFVKGTEWETIYRYYDYDEDRNGGINDYTAHGVFFVIRMPFELSPQQPASGQGTV